MLRRSRCFNTTFVSILLLCFDATVRGEQSNGSRSYKSPSGENGATDETSEKLGLTRMHNGIEGSVAGGVKSLPTNSQDDPRGKESSLSREMYRWRGSKGQFDSTANITTATEEGNGEPKKVSELLSHLLATAKDIDSETSAGSSTEEKTLGKAGRAKRQFWSNYIIPDLRPIIAALNSTACASVNFTALWPIFWTWFGIV